MDQAVASRIDPYKWWTKKARLLLGAAKDWAISENLDKIPSLALTHLLCQPGPWSACEPSYIGQYLLQSSSDATIPDFQRQLSFFASELPRRKDGDTGDTLMAVDIEKVIERANSHRLNSPDFFTDLEHIVQALLEEEQSFLVHCLSQSSAPDTSNSGSVKSVCTDSDSHISEDAFWKAIRARREISTGRGDSSFKYTGYVGSDEGEVFGDCQSLIESGCVKVQGNKG